MIDSTGRPIDNLLLLAIIEAAENFSRHGAEWRNKLAATFDILRHHGADFANCDGLGTHALVVAVTHGHRNVVDIILKNIGSDELRVHRNENHSLLHMALSLGQIQMARHLLKKGADPLAVAGSDNELTVLHELAAGITGEAAAQLAIDLVLHMGVPVDGVDPDYETPLAVALRCLNLPLAEIFLRLGANPNAAFHRRFNYEGEFANTVLGSLVQHPNEAGLHQVEFFLKAAEPFGLSDLAEVENSISALELVAKEMPTRRRLENSFEPPPIHPAAGKSQLRNDGACVKMADLLFRHFTHSRATRALFFAALATNLPVIKYLLQRGVSPSEVMHKPPFFSALEILLRMPLDRSEMLEMPGVVIMPEFIALFFSALRPFDGSSDGHGLDDDFSQSLSFDVAWERVEDAYRELGMRRQWLERELSEVMDGISLQILNLRLRMPFGIPV
jgi:ankyrin repeat protein